MDVTEEEEAEGVRFVWNAWPTSRVDASKMVIPLAVAVSRPHDDDTDWNFAMFGLVTGPVPAPGSVLLN